jgi:phospholipase/carboxylesterase
MLKIAVSTMVCLMFSALASSSQGAATATLATYAYPRRLGGCVNLSGWLPARDQFAAAVVAAQGGGANAATPCFWGHGSDDQIVAFENQVRRVTVCGSQEH